MDSFYQIILSFRNLRSDPAFLERNGWQQHNGLPQIIIESNGVIFLVAKKIEFCMQLSLSLLIIQVQPAVICHQLVAMLLFCRQQWRPCLDSTSSVQMVVRSQPFKFKLIKLPGVTPSYSHCYLGNLLPRFGYLYCSSLCKTTYYATISFIMSAR